MGDLTYRLALPAEMPTIRELLWKHGPNQWNHLPEEGVDQEFHHIESGQGFVIVAIRNTGLVGFAISLVGDACPSHIRKHAGSRNTLFIADVVVDPAFSGQGIGTQLLLSSIDEARLRDLKEVFIERHEENLASAGMMRKAAFSHVETFHDPAKRTSGSRNSSILKVDLA